MLNERDWKSQIRRAFETQAAAPDDDVLEELAGHAQAVYDAARAAGCSPDEADRRVRGQIDLWRRNAASLLRPSRRQSAVEPPPAFSASMFTGLLHDLNYAVRLLRRESRY